MAKLQSPRRGGSDPASDEHRLKDPILTSARNSRLYFSKDYFSPFSGGIALLTLTSASAPRVILRLVLPVIESENSI